VDPAINQEKQSGMSADSRIERNMKGTSNPGSSSGADAHGESQGQDKAQENKGDQGGGNRTRL